MAKSHITHKINGKDVEALVEPPHSTDPFLA